MSSLVFVKFSCDDEGEDEDEDEGGGGGAFRSLSHVDVGLDCDRSFSQTDWFFTLSSISSLPPVPLEDEEGGVEMLKPDSRLDKRSEGDGDGDDDDDGDENSMSDENWVCGDESWGLDGCLADCRCLFNRRQ